MKKIILVGLCVLSLACGEKSSSKSNREINWTSVEKDMQEVGVAVKDANKNAGKMNSNQTPTGKNVTSKSSSLRMLEVNTQPENQYDSEGWDTTTTTEDGTTDITRTRMLDKDKNALLPTDFTGEDSISKIRYIEMEGTSQSDLVSGKFKTEGTFNLKLENLGSSDVPPVMTGKIEIKGSGEIEYLKTHHKVTQDLVMSINYKKDGGLDFSGYMNWVLPIEESNYSGRFEINEKLTSPDQELFSDANGDVYLNGEKVGKININGKTEKVTITLDNGKVFTFESKVAP